MDLHYWGIVNEYTDGYIKLYFDDESMKQDKEIKQWFAFLELWTEGRLSDYIEDYKVFFY